MISKDEVGLPVKAHLDELLHLRYKPKKEAFANCDPCPAFKFFDWVIWLPDAAVSFRVLKPKTVLALAHPKSLKLLNLFRCLLKDTILVIAGEDTNLSEVKELVSKLRPYCKAIYFEAKDIEMESVKSFSMGFTSYYLNRSSSDSIVQLIGKVAAPDWKKSGVLAAWGGIWKKLDNQLDDRKSASKFVESSAWITREELDAEAYWERLAASEFLIAPAGQGIQAPKLAEAWLMHTVPIVTNNPCFRDLHDLGYPLLILDRWEDLNEDIIEEFNKNIRPFINWSEVNYMLTNTFFHKKILENSI